MEGEWNDYDEQVNLSINLYYAKSMILLVRLLFRLESLTSGVGGIEHEDFESCTANIIVLLACHCK